jgi:hypothetical protein
MFNIMNIQDVAHTSLSTFALFFLSLLHNIIFYLFLHGIVARFRELNFYHHIFFSEIITIIIIIIIIIIIMIIMIGAAEDVELLSTRLTQSLLLSNWLENNADLMLQLARDCPPCLA